MSSGFSGPKRCTLSSEIGMFKRLSSLNVLVSGLFTAGAGVATTGRGVLHLLREHWNYISSSLIKPKAKPTAKPEAKPVSYTVPMAVVSQPIMATCLHTIQQRTQRSVEPSGSLSPSHPSAD